MATIAALPPQYAQADLKKDEPNVQAAEIQLESDGQQDGSDVGEGDFSINAAHAKKRSGKPEQRRPNQPSKPTHPEFANGTTLENVATHMLCNDWFLKNVRNLVAEYKAMQNENMNYARDVVRLEREVANLKYQVRNITEERDEYKHDYDQEVLQHIKTKDSLRITRLELADLRNRYDLNLAELKRQKAIASEAIRENNRLKIDIADKDARIKDLEEKLRISNASEDAANERVTELQRCIYELERAKTSLEKEKDRGQKTLRAAEDTIKALRNRVAELERKINRLTRGRGGKIGITSAAAYDAGASGDEQDPLVEAQSEELPPVEAQAFNAPPPLVGIAAQESDAPLVGVAAYDPPVEAQNEPVATEAEPTSSPANEE